MATTNLYGARGGDWIFDDTGADEGFGGRGSDRIDFEDGRNNDRVTCGPGADDAAVVDGGDIINDRGNCEMIR